MIHEVSRLCPCLDGLEEGALHGRLVDRTSSPVCMGLSRVEDITVQGGEAGTTSTNWCPELCALVYMRADMSQTTSSLIQQTPPLQPVLVPSDILYRLPDQNLPF